MHVWNRNGNTSKQVIIHIKEKDTPKLTTKLYKQDSLVFEVCNNKQMLLQQFCIFFCRSSGSRTVVKNTLTEKIGERNVQLH